MTIDAPKVKGEPGTGYEPPAGKGPFECANCRYFDGSSCGQATMMKVSKLPRNAAGRVEVDAHGCCEYVDRKGSAPREAFKAASDLQESAARDGRSRQ